MKTTEFCFIVPAVPPTVNHYTGVARNGRRFRKPAADGFDLLVQAEWAKHNHPQIVAAAYAVDILIQLGAKRKGREPDLDNFCKVGIDALVHAQIITDDSRITHLFLHKSRGDCEQTVFTIRALVGSTEDHPVKLARVRVKAPF